MEASRRKTQNPFLPPPPRHLQGLFPPLETLFLLFFLGQHNPPSPPLSFSLVGLTPPPKSRRRHVWGHQKGREGI